MSLTSKIPFLFALACFSFIIAEALVLQSSGDRGIMGLIIWLSFWVILILAVLWCITHIATPFTG